MISVQTLNFIFITLEKKTKTQREGICNKSQTNVTITHKEKLKNIIQKL